MQRIKVGDEVAVMTNGSWTRGKVTAIHKGGAVDLTVVDDGARGVGVAKGATLSHVQHVSGITTYWHSQNTSEKMATTQADPAAIELD